MVLPATDAGIRVKQALIIPVARQNILKLSKASRSFQKLMRTIHLEEHIPLACFLLVLYGRPKCPALLTLAHHMLLACR